MLNLLSSNATNLFVDGLSELARQGEIHRAYNIYADNRCRDIDIRALIDWKNMTFDFNFKYRSYPSSLKKFD